MTQTADPSSTVSRAAFTRRETVASASSGATPTRNQRRQVLLIVAAASLPLIVLVIFGIAQGKVLAEARVAEERVALAQAGA